MPGLIKDVKTCVAHVASYARNGDLAHRVVSLPQVFRRAAEGS